MNKIYELTDIEYTTFFNKKKNNDIMFIIQVLMSNMSILINENINILNMFINQNMSEQNLLKKKFQTDFDKIKRKLKITQSIDQSIVVDKFYLIIRQNRGIINNLYNPEKIDTTISVQKLFNFLTYDENTNLKKMYNGVYWLFNKYGDDNHVNEYTKGILNGDDKTRIHIIINAIKTNYNDISEIIINSYKNIDTVIKIDNLSGANDTKQLCENIINKSTNDMGYKHMYLIIKIIKKMLLSYDDIYDNKYEYILFNVIVNELNDELINILSINTNNTPENDEINAIVDNIDTEILKKYNIILYDNLIKQNMFSDSTVDTQFINDTMYHFCTEINIYITYKVYIDYYIDILSQLILKCKMYLNNFLQLNIPLIRNFNKNLYNLLIVSDRYFNAKLHI